MKWTKLEYDGFTDYHSSGYAIIQQVTGNYALYRTFPNSTCSKGSSIIVGTLDECKAAAEKEK